MQLSEAVQQVGSEENIEAAFIRLYGGQVQPEDFRKLFNAVRRVPAEMLQKIQQHADKTTDEAFRAIHPDYVNVGEFMTAVLESRRQSGVAVPASAVAAVPDEETEVQG